MKHAIRAFTLVCLAVVVAACRPAPPPPPVQSCAGTEVESIIRAMFAGTGDEEWALRVAYRESRCIPGNRNQRSGAAGLFQLLNHDDLIFGACPNPWGIVAWDDPVCNAAAARFLYNGSGRAPWGG